MADILVTGATGTVGSEVAKGLSGLAGVRLAVRDVAQARQGADVAAEYVAFDFLNSATFAAAFRGVESLFLVRPPALANVKRDIAPALYAAKSAGVRHVVFVSLQGVERNRATPHFRIEELIRELGFRHTFLRCGFFMQNLSTTHRDEIRDKSEIAVPVGAGKTGFVDVRDIAAVTVRVLTHPATGNTAYTLTGSVALDYTEVAAVLSRVLGRTIRYTNPSVVSFVYKQVASGRPFGFALIMVALYTITRFGNAAQTTADVRELLEREPISFEQFARDYRDCWMVS